MKKISNLLMMALLAIGMGLTSCDEQLDNAVVPGVTPGTDEGEVTSIEVDLSKIDEKYLDSEKTKLQLTVGDEVTLSFTILPEEMASTEVELTAADATILSIDGLKVKALKEGETKVTAKAGEKTAECTVTVKAATVAVTSVTLDKSELVLTVGDAAVQLTATVKPDNATNADVDWTSSDVSVATVDGSGLVTAVADGTATITAKAGGKSATCTVTVSKQLTYPIALSAVTSDYIGSVIASDGNVYSAKTAVPAGKTAVAMIAYVGTASNCTHGLAIALADESGTKDFWAAVTACSGKAAVTGGTWRLPSEKDWQYMFIGCGSSESYSAPTIGMSKSFSGLASKLTTAQGDALQTSTSYYWSSTKYSLSNAWLVFFDGSSAFFYGDYEDQEYSVRACLAF